MRTGPPTWSTPSRVGSLTTLTRRGPSRPIGSLRTTTASWWARPLPAEPADTYEAEEGLLRNVGLDAAYHGFSGWGYLTAWKGDGQWVDFHVDLPPSASGMYDLTFRYAAALDASREVYVVGIGTV